MSAQSDVDAAVVALDGFFTQFASVAEEIKAAEQSVDTSKLDAIVQQVPAMTSTLNSLVPGTATTATTTTTSTS